jgi:hypothetical protein
MLSSILMFMGIAIAGAGAVFAVVGLIAMLMSGFDHD